MRNNIASMLGSITAMIAINFFADSNHEVLELGIFFIIFLLMKIDLKEK